jgi:ATP-dependent Lon protease
MTDEVQNIDNVDDLNVLENNFGKINTLSISDDAIYDIIDFYTREAGVRRLEQKIAEICRKTAVKLANTAKTRRASVKVNVSSDNLSKFLGIKKFTKDLLSKQDEIGLVNGMAYTTVGGVLLPLEVLVLDGNGKIEITGQLGDVMTESARIAISLARSLAKEYGIDPDFYKTKDIHIHAPEGAVPKDGPSAGVTVTTAIISALSEITVRRDVAMTGEITLHGNVLPIGGLKEKSTAAYKAGVKTIIFPKDNIPALEEIDTEIKKKVKFIPAENITEVLKNALTKTNITPFVSASEKDFQNEFDGAFSNPIAKAIAPLKEFSKEINNEII